MYLEGFFFKICVNLLVFLNIYLIMIYSLRLTKFVKFQNTKKYRNIIYYFNVSNKKSLYLLNKETLIIFLGHKKKIDNFNMRCKKYHLDIRRLIEGMFI